MNLEELKALPDSTSDIPQNKEALLQAARHYRDFETQMYKSLSGADIVDAPRYGLVADALGCLAAGKDLESVVAWADSKWRSHAKENNRKVEAAPKIKQGPYKGQSVIHYRWTDPEGWVSHGMFVRGMAKD